MSSIYDWSLSAASNANADDIINWSEGQPPSTVNNSARAMMQRVREFITDIGSVNKATGTATSLLVQLKSPVTTIVDGTVIKFTSTVDCASNATLNVNNSGAKPLYKYGAAGVIQINFNDIRNGGVHEAVYNADLNNKTGGWFVMNIAPRQSIPSGAVGLFATVSPPQGWLECNGQALSRKDYAELFAAIGTKWGDGDKTTTFNIPDTRGYFVRGWDNGRGIDSGRQLGSIQDSDNKAHNHSATCSNAGSHTHGYTTMVFWDSGPRFDNTHPWVHNENWQTDWAGDHVHIIGIGNSGGTESRPKNIAMIYAIKV